MPMPGCSHYYKGRVLKGLGSPHTPPRYVWSLGLITQALTTSDDNEVLDVFKMLLQTLGSNGLLHESNDVDNPSALTRPLFQWANSMFVVLFEQMTGQSCTEVRAAACAGHDCTAVHAALGA